MLYVECCAVHQRAHSLKLVSAAHCCCLRASPPSGWLPLHSSTPNTASVVGPVSACVAHESLLKVATGGGEGADEDGDRVIAFICDTPSAVAVSVAVCALLTADAVTLKPALVSPTGTFTEDGACSALLLLESVTSVWLAAAALR